MAFSTVSGVPLVLHVAILTYTLKSFWSQTIVKKNGVPLPFSFSAFAMAIATGSRHLRCGQCGKKSDANAIMHALTPSERTLSKRRIDFTMAASGAPVGTLHVVVDEGDEVLIDTEVLSTTFDRHLCHFAVLSNTTVRPLSGYRIVARGDTEVQLVDMPVELINAWFFCPRPGQFAGQRKWYKEFRRFAATWPLSIPQMDSIEQSYPPRFCDVPIRSLAPLILQVMVTIARHEIGGDDGKQPMLFRNEDGCIHSIVRRTNAPEKLVDQFVEEFMDANKDILRLICVQVAESPYMNYFL